MKVTPRQKTHTAVMKQWINFKFHFFFFLNKHSTHTTHMNVFIDGSILPGVNVACLTQHFFTS